MKKKIDGRKKIKKCEEKILYFEETEKVINKKKKKKKKKKKNPRNESKNKWNGTK